MKYQQVLEDLEQFQTMAEKIDYLNDMAYVHRFSNTPLMEELSHKALELARSINDKKRIARSWRNIGIVNIVYGFFDKSMECLQTAYQLYQEYNDEAGIAAVAGNIGRVYFSIGEHENAIQWYLKCIHIAEPLGLERDLGIACDNLAEVFMVIGEYHKAFEYVNKAIPLFEKLHEFSLLAVAYETLGELHYKQYDYEKAMEYQLKAIDIAEKVSDYSNVARGYIVIGKIYRKQRKYNDSLNALCQCIKYAEPIQNMDTLGNAYLQLALLSLMVDDYPSTLDYAEKSLSIAKETGMKHLEANAYKIFSEVYENQGDFKYALDYYKLYEKVQSETLRMNAEQNLKNIQMAFAVEKAEKEKEIFVLRNTELAEANFKIQKQKERIEKALHEIEVTNKQLEEKNHEILDSIIYAHRIQEAILNNEQDVKKLLPNSFLFFLPKDIVSGDFYWITEKEGKIFAAAVDCTGHGVPAAIISVIGNNLLNDIVQTKNIIEPGKILTQLHKGVQKILKQNQGSESETRDGMDIALVMIDPIAKQLKFAGAYSSLYINSRGILEEIQGDKYPIGGVQDEAFRIFNTHTFDYTGGEIIYLSTDGIPNQVGGAEGKRFKTKAFKDLLDDICTLDLEKQKQILHDKITKWMEGHLQIDDMLVWGIRL